MKKVGIWIRVSTNMQAQGDSPEHHEERAKMYAQIKNWEIVEIYHLEAVSGKSVLQHPEAQRMLADIRSGKIEGLIFSKIARLARNTKELLEIAEVFEEYNAGLISLDESIDTSSPSGRFTYTIISAMAQWEREEIAERVAASIPIRAKLGKSLGGQAPYGYQWNENKKLIIHEEEATIRKHMYDLFLKHKRKRTVANLLNEQGYSARKGNFSGTTVRRLLEDPIAKGLRRTNYTTARKGKKEIKGEDAWEYIKVPALISEEKWNKVQAILTEQASRVTRPSKTNIHLFTGIVHCSCGGKMYVLSKTEKYTCKNCKRKISVADLETIFQEQLHSFSMSDDSVDDIIEQSRNTSHNIESLFETTKKEITLTEKKIQSLFTLHETGQLATEDFAEHHKEPKEKLLQLRTQKEQIEYELNRFSSKSQHLVKAFSVLKDVYGRWNTLSKKDKRSIIESMAETIVIHEDSIDIKLIQLNPSFSESVTFEPHNPKDSSRR